MICRYRHISGWAFCCLWLLAACTPKPDPQPDWPLQKQAIELTFHADPQVNFYAGQPHTLTISLFQLDEPNAYKQLAEREQGRRQLLAQSKDLPPQLASERFYLEPGETRTLVFDRAERARWIAIAAGYFDPQIDATTAVEKIDYVIQREGLITGEKAAIPRFRRLIYLSPAGLKVREKP